MRAVTVTGPGTVELNYMWLPTFIGLGNHLKKELEAELAPLLVGKPLDDDTLNFAHDYVLTFLCKKFPLEGLRDYLDALKFVQEK